MDRLACLDVPELPLQLLLREHPEWSRLPAAVVDRDHPNGRLVWLSPQARKAGIRTGMTYAAALSVSAELRAGEVTPSEVRAVVSALTRRLQAWTPGVEPCPEEPGAFWLDARGLDGLYGSLDAWAREIRTSLKAHEGLTSAIVVGFTPFGALAVVKGATGELKKSSRERECLWVLRSPEEENEALRRVPLECVLRDVAARDFLGKLGVRTVGEFIALPPEGLERRLGKAVRELHALARGKRSLLFQAAPMETPLVETVLLDYAETDLARLIAIVELRLDPLLRRLASGGLALAEVRIRLELEQRRHQAKRSIVECLRPASPTLDVDQIRELLVLRLTSLTADGTSLPGGVNEVELTAEGRPALREQLELFAETSPRDLDAASRALARLRAEFGEGTVVRAWIREGHLPEAQYAWERLERIPKSRPGKGGAVAGGAVAGGAVAGGAVESAALPLIRRLYDPPLVLPARPRHEPDGWILRGLQEGPVIRVLGPYIVAGGWWRRDVHREYHFAETQRGDILWLYYDRNRRRWFLQGRVE